MARRSPKSVGPERVAENFDVFDFDLSLAAIDALASGVRGGLGRTRGSLWRGHVRVARLWTGLPTDEREVVRFDLAHCFATLGAFINEVNAQTGKKISTAQAASLNSQAQNIEAALDC